MRRLLLSTAILLVPSTPAMVAHAGDNWVADNIPHTGRLASGNAFDLHFSRENLGAKYDDGSRGGDIRMTTLGLGLHEMLADNVRGSLRIAGVEASQRNREATSDLDPDGYHAEVDVGVVWPRGERFALGYGGRWRYTNISDDALRMTWHTWALRTALHLRLAPRISARLGISVHEVDGTEKVRGDDVRTTTDFASDQRSGAYAQLDFRSGRSGVVRFRLRGGNPQEAMIVFEQQY